MITHPALLLLALAGLVGGLKLMSGHSFFGKLFHILPMPFWCYMLPMAVSSAGWIPRASPVYTFFSTQVLPVCIMLLLIGTHLKMLSKLGPMAFTLLLVGAVGTVLGGLTSFMIYKPWLPDHAWALTGALTASWLGGSMNMVAVKEALLIEDSQIAPIVIIDATISYSWMALLMAGTKLQERWNRWAGVKKHIHLPPEPKEPHTTERWHEILLMVALSILLSIGFQRAASFLPTFGGAMNVMIWTVLLVTTVALALTLTPLSTMSKKRIPDLGAFLLYLILATIGARADILAITKSPVFFAYGLTWILIHGLFILTAGFFLKAPLGLIATTSQAAIGGVISGPIVGATYEHRLAGAGLLLAIAGYILGTYVGLLTAAAAKILG